MEYDGPSRNTRSKSDNTEAEGITDLSEFPTKTTKTPARKERTPGERVSRTPSGQVLTNSVRDIRKFFTSEVLPNSDGDKFDSQEEENSQDDCEFTRVAKRNRRKSVNKVKGNQPLKAKQIEERVNAYQHDDTTVSDESESEGQSVNALSSKKNQKLHASKGNDVFDQDYCEGYNISASVKETWLKDQSDTELYKGQRLFERVFQETSEECSQQLGESEIFNMSNPEQEKVEVIDLCTVVEMFKQIKDNISLEKTAGEPKESGTEVSKLKAELEQFKSSNKVLSGVVTRQDDVIRELQNKVEMLELHSMRKSIVLSGLYCNNKKAQRLNEIYNFMKEEVGIEIGIEDVFSIGMAKPPSLVITLESMADKRLIFQNMNVIKELENKDGKGYYVSDYLPAEINEMKRRDKEVFRNNSELDELQQKNMTMRAGKLFIDGAPYKKKIQPPNSKAILSMEKKDLREVLNTPTSKGSVINKNGNRFVGYACDAENHKEVANAYLKIKLLHPSARHIMCAYNLPGIETYIYRDYCDDQEVGAGRKMLQILEENDITHKAVFVVRYIGQGKMGPKRFQVITDAVYDVLNSHPYNKKTKSEQKIMREEEKHESAENVTGDRYGDQKGNRPRMYRGGRRGARGPRRGMSTSKSNRRAGLADSLRYKFSQPWEIPDNGRMRRAQSLGQESWPELTPDMNRINEKSN